MPTAPSNPSSNSSKQPTKQPDTLRYRVIDTIRDPDGVIATITERVDDGRVSFSLAREITKDGKTDRTAYLQRRHLPAALRLLTDLAERLELAEDQARARRR